MELLLVVSLITVISVSSGPYLSRFMAGSDMKTSSDKIVRTLRKAQNYSINGKGNSVWGVHYQAELLVLFKGSDFATRDTAFDETFDLPQTLEVIGWGDLYFNKVRGIPSSTLSAIIRIRDDQRTIEVNQEGVVDLK
jgi:hypothetical protein